MYAYSITDGPVSINSHKGVVQLRTFTDTDQTFIEWTVAFDADESSFDSIKTMFEEAIPQGMSALKSKFA